MNWAAYYLADGEMRHTIAVAGTKYRAEFERDKFVGRMNETKPQIFWAWVEETNECRTV